MDKLPEKFRKHISHVDNQLDAEMHKENPSPLMAMSLVMAQDDLDLTKEHNVKGNFEDFEYDLKKKGIKLTGLFKDKVKVLEVGSGNAQFVDFAKGKGVDIIGVDANPRGPVDGVQINARIEQLPFADASFDVVYSRAVFDKTVYDQYPQFMVQEIFRILKPGGLYMGYEFNEFPAIKGFTRLSNSQTSHTSQILKKLE